MYFAAGFARVLKAFAVRYGLRLTLGQDGFPGAEPLVRRKALRTFAKSFLMHAHKSLRKICTNAPLKNTQATR